MTGSTQQRKLANKVNTVVFFGADGGCLDAYFLANEIYTINNKILLSDKPHKFISGVENGGGFLNLVNYPGSFFVYQCGNSKNHMYRQEWFNRAKAAGLRPLTCPSRHAYIHESAVIGSGCLIYPGVTIMPNVILGENVIILPNAVVNHDTQIGDGSIINSSVILNGNVKCGSRVYIGSGTIIRERCQISDNTTIGAGSLILNDILEEGLYFGSPASKVKN